MTSKQFLSAMGEPTAMEAEIGLVYEREGLEAAFQYIAATFVPIFRKQQNNRKKTGGSYRTKK